MMRRLRDKFVALIMLIVFLFYVGYRIYEPANGETESVSRPGA